MREVIIQRLKAESSQEWGTFGRLSIPDTGFICVTVERPWIDNQRDNPATPQNESSCVPSGTYLIKLDYSPKHGKRLYELQGVPNRSEVQIHAANYARELLGCIAVGHHIEDMGGGKGITNSAVTLKAFMLTGMCMVEEARLIIEDGA